MQIIVSQKLLNHNEKKDSANPKPREKAGMSNWRRRHSWTLAWTMSGITSQRSSLFTFA